MASSRSFAPKEFRGANDNDIIETTDDWFTRVNIYRKRAKAKAKAEDTKAKKIITKAKAGPKAKKIIAKAKAKTEGTKAKKIIAK